jgi:lipoate-protein ligase A
MLCIRNDITDPYFNIAAEEYFLQESDQEYFLLYINEPSVIIGKHQNAYAEINYDYIRENNIKVVRRISGGGAVWHDPGNLNFSFIRNGREGELVNFRRHMQPVLNFLTELGLKASFEGKNSIVVNRYKVSGNAEHVFKNRILHHGTLLFNTNLTDLSEALQVDSQKYLDRAVKSVRSSTTNIADQLSIKMNIKEFGNIFFQHIIKEDPDSRIIELKSSDNQKIKDLVNYKYSKWEWNFGYSPPYKLNRMVDISGFHLGIFLQVEKAHIIKITISGNLLESSLRETLESALTGQKHEEDTIIGILKQAELRDVSNRINPEELIKVFF